MQHFRNLAVADLADGIALSTYRLTRRFPRDEVYGLRQQMRRSAVSIGSNIAEGSGRLSDPDFRRFLGMASGSASELWYQTELAVKLGYCDQTTAKSLTSEIESLKRALSGLIRYLK